MRGLLLLPLVLVAAVATACESSFDKADRIRAEQGTVAEAEAAVVNQVEGVTAETLAIIPSDDGMLAAVVIEIRSTATQDALLWAPIEVNLLADDGSVVGTNNVPGAEPTLIHLPSLRGGERTLYVNDQIALSGVPATAEVTVGGTLATSAVPEALAISNAVVQEDPSFGTSWSATVTNQTPVRQEQVIVQAIIRDRDAVTGAGIAIVEGLDPGASAEVQGFFLGSTDGDLELLAPASNGEDGTGAPPRQQAGEAEAEMITD